MLKTSLKTTALLIITLFLFGFNQNAGAFENISERCLQYKPFAIDISSLMDFYRRLEPDEKEEQIRDWGFYGLFCSLGLKESEIGPLSGQSMQMRYPSLKESLDFTVLPGRIAALDKKDCIMLVSQNEASDPVLLGSIFDKGRFSFEEIPQQVHIFAYSADTEKGMINTSYVRTVKGSDLLSANYGYLRMNITNAADLTKFLNEVDSVTSLEFKDKSIILSGRRNKFGKSAALSLDDVASLFQAYIKYVPKEAELERKKSYDAYIAQKYAELLKKDKKLKNAIKTGRAKYSTIITQIKKRYPYQPLEDEDPNVGFSLDPLLDYDGLSRDLRALASGQWQPADKIEDPGLPAILARFHSNFLVTSQKIASKQDITPFLKLRRALADSKTNSEKHLDNILYDIELKNTYQTARYDGRLKGTNPAMILFYTDLTAKLWALDYNKLSPKGSITGFQTLSGIKIPKFFWDDFVKLSKTRLWFGLRQESFDIGPGSVIFEPVATRVYAASSDPLYPGKETKPNYQSGSFLGWWDRHYSAVADYDPYFYKLNELLKWSCLFMVIKEKHVRSLDFLQDVPVDRTLDFEAWYKNEPSLKNKTALPFVDRKRFNKTTECFKILSSESYAIMGQRFFISGGVSLASRKDILKKLSRHTENSKEEKALALKKKLLPERSYAKNKSFKEESPVPKVKREQKNPALKDFGDFSAKVEKQNVKLEWNRKEGAVLDECVNSLVELQATDSQIRKSENIFSKLKDVERVARVEAGKAYIIKTKGLKDKWIYVSVSPKGKPSGFAAKAAGTEPDSDIFYAKAIGLSMAEKMIATRQAVTILQ